MRRLSRKGELTEKFLALWSRYAPDMPEATREYVFAPPRRFRFDVAWPEHRVAVELDGGVWVGGRHTRPAGFVRDCEKLNLAVLRGWRVLRYTASDLKLADDSGCPLAVSQVRYLLSEGDKRWETLNG